MENPTRQRQLEELDQVELCTRILYQARNELYVNMHFLDVSLSSLGFEASTNVLISTSSIFREDIFPNCSTVILSLQSNKTARYSDGYVTPGLSPRLITLMIFTPFSVSFLFLLPDIFNSFLFCRAGNHSVSFFIKYYCFR